MAMKFGIMRAHQERIRNEGRVVAQLPAPARKPAEPQGKGVLAGQQLEGFLTASLAEDLDALKGLNSVERKIGHKRDILIPKYESYVDRLRAASSSHELLGYWLVWLFDAGLIEKALKYAAWFFESGLPLPEKFKSSPRFFTASKLVEWAEGEQAAGHEVEPYFGDTFAMLERDPDVWNLNDETLGRFYRLRGLTAERNGDLELAESSLQRALTLGAKVKTALERVRKNIKKGTDEGAQASGEAPDEAPGEDAAGDDSPAATAPAQAAE